MDIRKYAYGSYGTALGVCRVAGPGGQAGSAGRESDARRPRPVERLTEPGAGTRHERPGVSAAAATIASDARPAYCSPDSMSFSWTTPSARSRSPATSAKRAPERFADFIASLRPLPPNAKSAATPALRSSVTSAEEGAPGLLAERHRVDAGGGGQFELDALGLQREHRTVHAERPADRRQRGAADHLGQAVVAAAAADRGLRAEPVVDELEGGAGVVVEAADQPRVVLVRHARRGQQLAHLLVVALQASHR